MAKRADVPEFGMLRGVTVVNASTVVAGPIAASLMAEMGADVIWIESTKSPDTNRGKGGMGAEGDRKNMRNISLDIPSPEGREILKKLLTNADIFIESSKGGTYTKWGLTDEVLWSWNPKLVIAHFSGYGQSGDPDYVSRGCYDPVCQAFSGYMALQGFKDREPLAGREVPTDYLAGLSGLANILAALRYADKTGKGESFDIAQFEMAARFQNKLPMDYFNDRKTAAPLGAHNDITAAFRGNGTTRFFSRKGMAYVCIEDGVICRDGRKVLPVKDILIPGVHNIENYMAAIAVVEGLVSDETIRHVAETFGGVEHRIELVRVKDGVRFYNDSIASSPSRTIAGLRSFPEKVILIAGGYDKHIPYDVLGPEICAHVKKLYLGGATGQKIREAVERCPKYDPKALEIVDCGSFEPAVRAAAAAAKPGDVVLMSPASAAFDQFKNFMVRGAFFKKLIKEL